MKPFEYLLDNFIMSSFSFNILRCIRYFLISSLYFDISFFLFYNLEKEKKKRFSSYFSNAFLFYWHWSTNYLTFYFNDFRFFLFSLSFHPIYLFIFFISPFYFAYVWNHLYFCYEFKIKLLRHGSIFILSVFFCVFVCVYWFYRRVKKEETKLNVLKLYGLFNLIGNYV